MTIRRTAFLCSLFVPGLSALHIISHYHMSGVEPPGAESAEGAGFCNWGWDGTGVSSICEGGAQGGDWCNASREQCEGGCSGRWCTGSDVPAGSVGSGLSLTAYWDCSGLACDATTLRPWDHDRYLAAKGYQPQDPNDHGGPAYGEKMWLTAAVANIDLGESDGCCGDTMGGGCGKCILIDNPQSINPDWTAVVMKKTTCGNCRGGPHVDVNVPGFDILEYSMANVCGAEGTGLTKVESSLLGKWYFNWDDTKQAQWLCDRLPAEYRKGCRLFTEWGWTSTNPTNANYRVVECPQAFVDFVGGQFDEGGLTA